ncbi:hypothetical protein ID866_6278 [Astraeus odoratus]|nr:hypothetical protein ID866_6278 [Astraeus odoratus]
MDIHYDEAWCPVCDRQIIPKRFTIPVPQSQPQQQPVPSPSSSSSSSKEQQNDKIRTKTAAGRVRAGGLLQGTGRVRPYGALKRTDSDAPKARAAPQQQQQHSTKPAVPTKLRTVIDQGPIPLYCSDECRLSDISRLDGAYSIDYDPRRTSPPLPPVPHNSFERPSSCESEDESGSGSGSSLGSRSCASDSGPISPSMATLAAIYEFPPLPPAPPIVSTTGNTPSEHEHSYDYQSGVMMAAKRIQAALCPPKQRSSLNNAAHTTREPIPGWTDGSDSWRQSVYSLSPCPTSVTGVGTEAKASFAASSHRGVQWTSSAVESSGSSSSLPTIQPAVRPLTRSSQSYNDELYAKYSLPLSRRSESRTTLFPPSTSYSSQSLPPLSPTSTSSRRRRENPLLKAGAEGRLLVPNVALRAHSSSSQSVSSASLCSPLSRYPSELSEDSMWTDQRSSSDSLPPASQPPVSVRSWSYDNVKTYPLMKPPPKKERRWETRVIEGETKQIEVEVEVTQPLKRLFLFPGKETNCEARW